MPGSGHPESPSKAPFEPTGTRMRRAPTESTAMRPARQRIAVAHRVFPEIPASTRSAVARRRTVMETLHVRRQFVVAPGRDQSSLYAAADRLRNLGGHRPVGQSPVLLFSFQRSDRSQASRKPALNDHRAPVEKHRPFLRAAPQHDAVPAGRAFVRKEYLPHSRVDPIGADQHVAARRCAMRT